MSVQEKSPAQWKSILDAELDLEKIQSLEDADLVMLGQIGEDDAKRITRDLNMVKGEITRRMQLREVARLATPFVIAEFRQLYEKRKDVPKAMELLRPLVSQAEFDRAFKLDEPPPPPPPTINMHLQVARALAKKAGPKVLEKFEKCIEDVPKGQPKVVFITVGSEIEEVLE